MNSYFFKMTNQDRNNILDQHKHVYDGFATQYGQPKEQSLYVQDFANDKGGLTVSNKGNVSTYKNMNINEMYYSGDAEFTPEETFDFGGPDKMYVSVGEQKDMIGDGPYDFDFGTFEDDETEILVGPNGEFEIFADLNDKEPKFNDVDELDSDYLDFEEIIDDETEGPLMEQVNKTLDMFRRFKKY